MLRIHTLVSPDKDLEEKHLARRFVKGRLPETSLVSDFEGRLLKGV